jgi:hypothetical protein
MSPPFSWSKNKPRKKPVAGRAFDGLHGGVSQKIELFITPAERTSDPSTSRIHCRTETSNIKEVEKS